MSQAYLLTESGAEMTVAMKEYKGIITERVAGTVMFSLACVIYSVHMGVSQHVMGQVGVVCIPERNGAERGGVVHHPTGMHRS